MYRLRTEQVIPLPISRVFSFFERPENLEALTPKWLGFKIVTPMPVPMAEGLELEYTVRLLGIRIGWRSRITSYTPPFQFIDEQVRGPYKVWRHTHRFVEEAGGTRVIDDVEYALYGGWIAPYIHRLYVRPSLNQIFKFRAKALGPLLGLPSIAS